MAQAFLGLSSEIVETTRIEFLNLPPIWVLVLVVLPAVVFFCRWLYGKAPVSGRQKWALGLLRSLALILVLLFLFEPVHSHQRMRVEKPLTLVLLDDSASFRERDLGDLAEKVGLPRDATRLQLVQQVLALPLEDLKDRYEVSLHAFGESLRPVGGLEDLIAADVSTRLGDAFSAVAGEMRGMEVAHVLVVTDGRVNGGRDVQAALSSFVARAVPVSLVGVGDSDVPQDLRISNVTVPEIALAGDTVNLEVTVSSRGYSDMPAVVTVEDGESNRELGRIDLVLSEGDGGSEKTLRIPFIPDREGELDLLVSVQPVPGEQNVDNNRERRLLRIEPGKIRVLYVDGYPRYEYRFLVGALLRSSNIELQCLLLSADADFIQESTQGVPPLTRFPDSLDYLLKNYHVLVFGDVHPESLGGDPETHIENIRRFVEAGGGFLMQAGSLYSPQSYAGTAIEHLLPVIFGDPAVEQMAIVNEGVPFRPHLERARDPHEIVTLHPDNETNQSLWEGEGGLEPLTWYAPVAKARATAEVLLTHPTSRNVHGPHVLLATMYFPQGRTAYLGTDETWRWRMRFLETYREPFWRGLIRFLALNKLRRSDFRFDLATDRSDYDLGDRMTVTARILDDQFEPNMDESIEAFMTDPSGVQGTLLLTRDEPGVYVGTLLADEAGPFRLWLEDSKDEESISKSLRIVTVSVPSAEQDDAILDSALLRSVAARTGGRYVPLREAEDLLAGWQDLPMERPLDEPELEELWSGFPQLFVLVGLLAAEWIVRKRSNLI